MQARETTIEAPPVRIAALGIDERIRNSLRLFFHDSCKDRFQLVEEETADAVIIDLDHRKGVRLAREQRQLHPTTPVIVISRDPRETGSLISLLKPLKKRSLAKALLRAEAQAKEPQNLSSTLPSLQIATAPATPAEESGDDVVMEGVPSNSAGYQIARHLAEKDIQAFLGSTPDIDTKSAQQQANIRYDPDSFFQGKLRQITAMMKQKGQAVRLQFSDEAFIILYPDEEIAQINMSESRLGALSAVPISPGGLSFSFCDDLFSPDDVAADSLMRLDALLWKTALWASRGRIPYETDLHRAVALDRWPNLTRLLLLPNTLEIAALWAEQPHSLIETAAKLKIPQRYVFGFYSAVFALGLANTGETLKTLDYIPIAADAGEKQPASASWLSNWIPFFRSKNG